MKTHTTSILASLILTLISLPALAQVMPEHQLAPVKLEMPRASHLEAFTLELAASQVIEYQNQDKLTSREARLLKRLRKTANRSHDVDRFTARYRDTFPILYQSESIRKSLPALYAAARPNTFYGRLDQLPTIL